MESDYLQDLGLLALGSRLKRLSDRLSQEVSQIYEDGDLDFQPRWFPVFRCIAACGPIGITEIAQAVGITHPAVNQIEQELSAAGLLTITADTRDKRRRLLKLSTKGKRLGEELKKTWSYTHAAISDAVEESEANLLTAILAFERALEQEGLLSRMKRLERNLARVEPEVVRFSQDLAPHFVRLNRAWIEQYFSLEEADHELFKDPQKIVRDGGQILFAGLGDKIVGTCALVKKGKNSLELAKMAVDEAYRDRGIGRKLMAAAVEAAIETGAEALVLETNSKLAAAVALYRKFGFEPFKTESGSEYSRVDLTMKLDLKKQRG